MEPFLMVANVLCWHLVESDFL